MRFLIDEDVPRPVGDYLLKRGHAVFFVEDALVNGSADTLLAQWVDVNEGVVVTFNHKHFKVLVARVPVGGRSRFRKASRLSLKCKQTQALRRVTELAEDIEWEYAKCQQRNDKRLMCEIGDSYFKKDR